MPPLTAAACALQLGIEVDPGQPVLSDSETVSAASLVKQAVWSSSRSGRNVSVLIHSGITGSHDQVDKEILVDTLHVDCEACVARGPACGDCVITVLLGAPPHGVDLDTDEQAALAALADSGLVPPLRLVAGARPVRSVPSPPGWQTYG